MPRPYLACALLVLSIPSSALAAPASNPVLTPGPAIASDAAGHLRLSNAVVAADWNQSAHTLHLTDRLDGEAIMLASPFSILLNDGRILNVTNLQLASPVRRELIARPSASRAADRVPGIAFEIPWKAADGSLSGTWSLVLGDGANYVREVLTITAGATDAAIATVKLLDETLPSARVVGSVKGSPIVTGDLFLGFEHPLSESDVTRGRASAYLNRVLPLKAGQSITYSAVVGVARAGQMRRDLLAYVERERAHPYRTFLHYNSWYDLGYFTPYTEEGALDRINTFGKELHDQRGVTLDSFLFDDGWDDHSTLWHFHPKDFPSGFTEVTKTAERYGANPGIWMSPWGGYSKPKLDRLDYGRKQGYEIVGNGFALSGPKYYERFHEMALDMVRKYNLNQFKIDGTGNANSVFKGSAFDSDFAAALSLIGDLRALKPDIFINLTTGTYPSPFWLMTSDSIWRGGEDDDFAGVGSYRERWITYRDADTYARIVKAGPLFPLNSLMLHGIIYARFHKHLNTDPGNDLRHEIRSYFGTGTQLQELYITPSLLSTQNWDDLAEAAKWSRTNAETLKDTHWVGGDPAWGEPYGWAAWSPAKAILTLRNPSDQPKTITLDAATAFELPAGAPRSFNLKSPWKDDAQRPAVTLTAGHTHTFTLAPFEVLNLEASATK